MRCSGYFLRYLSLLSPMLLSNVQIKLFLESSKVDAILPTVKSKMTIALEFRR